VFVVNDDDNPFNTREQLQPCESTERMRETMQDLTDNELTIEQMVTTNR